mmetsp:Transcript_43034/g.52201  ORF Transcript_43034/g.52201 Transcript_43034/m.52201 type:complete len:289 (+) Transcript_43034:77-943(+)|eukprot:CAMPEP_0197844168 /NCGR_PEP_ID=MMETSP1438-20131217/1153_1 /TAXON_ID=1461541 /ORGANISM="Pterosperma sp., Strain CCMP1384" /LENGTH=288 /DNA_ID=CAMNT_0043454809 /DNA_START=76 /DNA_END=942 /DNA_ORIENTATION=+
MGLAKLFASCCGSSDTTEEPDSQSLSRGLGKREETWQRTGIIGVRDCGLKELPKSVFTLGNVARNLDATNNNLERLPPELGNLNLLKNLTLASNKLVSLPMDIGKLVQLKVLALDHNMLTSLPEDIGLLVKLEKLTLSNNRLNQLPNTIGKCTKLTQLVVSKNNLSELPLSVGELTNLEFLDAGCNSLVEIPSSLSACKRLAEVMMDQNGIRTVPSEVLIECIALHTLSLHQNPINIEVLQKVNGYDVFAERLKAKHDKRIAGGVLIGERGLDDGLDHNTTKIVVPHI